MTQKKSILGIVMAGGKGERLYPLTIDRSKPSVPFGGKYRIVDFALSNFVNSGIYSIYVLVQYKSQSLIEHIRSGWRRQGMLVKHFITVVPPQMRAAQAEWYRGTADAVYQNLNLIIDFRPEVVCVFGGDHIYRMNISQMLDFHHKNKADVTVASLLVDQKESSQFGVLGVDKKNRVVSFEEKPQAPKKSELVGDKCLISMGNYIFNTKVLLDALLKDAEDKNSSHDFGKDVIPRLIKEKNVYAYNFMKNRIPALKKYEEQSYWRDVGTIYSFWKANMDLLGEKPALDLDNQQWPIYASSLDAPPAKLHNNTIINSMLSEGCNVQGAHIENSIIGRGVRIGKNTRIKNSIILDFTIIGENAVVQNAIVDRFNTLEKNSSVGVNLDEDKKKYFVDDHNIVVLRRGGRNVLYW